MDVLKVTQEDRKNLISFIDRIFQVDFQKIMSKVYSEEEPFEQYHYCIKEQETICAALGIYPQEYHIGNHRLKTGFIGSVSVDSGCRGKGYMKQLMHYSDEVMKQNGYALAILGGRRNRYGFFGYELGGQCYEFNMTEENIRLTIGWNEDPGLQLIEVTDPLDSTFNQIYSIHCKNRLWCCDRNSFYHRCFTWDYKLLKILKDGEWIGYMISSRKNGYIAELELLDWDLLLRVLRNYMSSCDNKEAIVQAHVWEPEKARALQTICESYLNKPNLSIKILDYLVVFKTLLQLKQTYTQLQDGVFRIQVMNVGDYQITIQNGEVTVTEFDESFEPDLILTEREVVNVLMSPACELYESQSKNGFPKGWFPLEFSCSNVDEF